MEAAFYLARQCTHLAAIVSCLKPIRPLVRNPAILTGLAVRLSKLMKILIRDLSNREPYQQLGISRQVIETIATLEYLLADDGSGTRFDQYVQNSLIAEREVLDDIKRNIKKRGGNPAHIETRMTRSIEETARAAGVNGARTLRESKRTKVK
jgi:hypothetical protein